MGRLIIPIDRYASLKRKGSPISPTGCFPRKGRQVIAMQLGDPCNPSARRRKPDEYRLAAAAAFLLNKGFKDSVGRVLVELNADLGP
jgi:hypothetical protein